MELAKAIYESSMNGMAPAGPPLARTTGYEKAVHEDYRAKFGRPIDRP